MATSKNSWYILVIISLTLVQPKVDSRLLSPVAVDLRVVVMWDTDMTDVELHVEYVSSKVTS